MTIIPSFDDVMVLTRTISGSPALEDDAAFGLYLCLIQVPRGGLVVEIGCQLGRSSSMILQLGRAIGFHAIHIDPYTSQIDMLKQWVEMMHQAGGDFTHAFTLMCMRTEQAGWLLERLGQIDLAYIDGDHGRAEVALDCQMVAERIKPNGLLTAHDYGHDSLPDVTEALDAYITEEKWQSLGVAGTLASWRRKS